MAEFEKSILINADADRVFDFVTNLNNLPEFLPITQRADHMLGLRHAGRRHDTVGVRVRGETSGSYHEMEGWLNVDPIEYFMEWSADSEDRYHGWLQVEEMDTSCELTIHLSFLPRSETARLLEASNPRVIEQSLVTALESVKNGMESAPVPVAMRTFRC